MVDKILDSKLSDASGVRAKRTGTAGDAKSAGKSASSASPTPVTQPTDRVEVSGAKQQMEVLRNNLESIPDVRLDRVAAVKEKISSGYQVSAEDIAQAMVHEAMRYG